MPIELPYSRVAVRRQSQTVSIRDDHDRRCVGLRVTEAVCEELRSWVDRLERGAANPNELVITNRVSKKREDYTQSTRSVAALERAAELGLARAPGQSVSYVVVNDVKRSRERVLLASEELDEYDVGFYREVLVRAAASVLSPLGWREKRIEKFLSSLDELSFKSFL
jgi:DNA polymerase, archaea type